MLSVLDVDQRRIMGRLVVGQKAIVVRMHPDGRRAFVSSEESGDLTVVRLPAPPSSPVGREGSRRGYVQS